MFCSKCGNQLPEGAIFCQKCGEKIYNEGTIQNQEKADKDNDEVMIEVDNVDDLEDASSYEEKFDKKESEPFDENTWKKELFDQYKAIGKEWLDKFKEMPIIWKVLTALGALAVLLIVIVLIRIVFSSLSLLIALGIGGYFAYQRWGARYMTEFVYYHKPSKLLLPKGMSPQTLLEALSGKFNYPYFKGVRYGEKGECVIEGQYGIYPVEFYENNTACLTYVSQYDDKKYRIILLEAMAICSYVNKFFNPMLPINVEKDLKLLKSAERQRKMTSVVYTVALLLLIFAVTFEYTFPGGLEMIVKPGAGVRNACLSQYSEKVTIEDAFDNFFDNEKWSTYKDKEYSYVVFTGSCEYMGEKTDVRITFKITGENFIINSLDINGQSQGDWGIYLLLSEVYERY